MAAGSFVLTENERIATASVLRDGVLICRPLGVARWRTVILVPTSLVLAGLLLASPTSGSSPALYVAAALLVGASGWFAATFARSQIRADEWGLHIRDRARTRRIPWADVHGFGVVEQNPPARWLPRLTETFTWHVSPREVVPVVQLKDGSEIKLLPLTSSDASSGWSQGGVTTAQLRATVLARFHAAHL